MTVVTAGRIEKCKFPAFPVNVDYSKRQPTDKYWIALFIIAILGFIITAPRVVKFESVCDINTTTANSIFKHPSFDKNGNNWLFNKITHNIGFLDGIYTFKSGYTAVCAHIVLAICLIIYGFNSMRTDRIYCTLIYYTVLIVFSAPFLCNFICWGLLTLPNDSLMPRVPKLFGFTYFFLWSLPGVILWIIARTKNPSIKIPSIKQKNDKDKKVKKNVIRHIFFPVTCFGLITMISIIIMGSFLRYKLKWDNIPSCIISISAICYLILCLQYFALMVSSCLATITFEKNRMSFRIFYAMFIIARYHFGTACYRATLIFPRLHATFVMNEPEFIKANPELSVIDRFYLTHWKVHNTSTSMTAVQGSNHSTSIRELLRIFTSDSPKLKYFQIHSQIFRPFTALLIASHCLILVTFWFHNVIFDPQMLLGIWLSYLIGSCITYLILKHFDAVLDTMVLHKDENTLIYP